MSIQVGCLYWTRALLLQEVNTNSPLTSFLKSFVDIQRIRINNTGRICYVAEFDAVTSIGVVFLGTNQPLNCRFLRVVGIESSDVPGLGLDPPIRFPEALYLNYTHPVRVTFERLAPQQFTDGSGRVVTPSPRLDASSADVFWELYRCYNKGIPYGEKDPCRRGHEDDDEDGGHGEGGRGGEGGRDTSGDGGGGGGGGDSGHGGGGGGEDSREDWQAGELEYIAGLPNFTNVAFAAAVKASRTEDAPWGKFGRFRVGIDLPMVLQDPESESEDEDEDDTEPKGTIYITDICVPSVSPEQKIELMGAEVTKVSNDQNPESDSEDEVLRH